MRLNQAHKSNKFRSKSGIVLFVVLGGIFVLTILVLSYNHLVRGKFNENREILTHIRAMKCAQAVSRYIVAKMKADLGDANSVEENSPGNILRTIVFKENNPDIISDKLEEKWLDKIDYDDMALKLLAGYTLEDFSINTEVKFSDIVQLKEHQENGEFFFNFEKAGKMEVFVSVEINGALEEWSEIRPFRVIVPYPVPLTKFSLYVRRAVNSTDPVRYNTVAIDSSSNGKVAGGSAARPFVLNNGFQGENYNREADIWKKRGWVYLGGGNVLLNRAAGNTNYGQRYHSYFPEANMPVALVLQFPGFSPLTVGSKNLVFRMARWGFSKSMLSGTSAEMWKNILEWQLANHPPSSQKRWWLSSSLHLFGKVGNSDAERNLSITRVCGKVYDRFIEVGYIVPEGNGEAPVGAVIGLNKTEFNKASRKPGSSLPQSAANAASSFTTDTWVDNELIYLPVSPEARLGVPDFRELEDFFKNLPYQRGSGRISYNKIMSRADFSPYHESYNMIAQYAKNSQNINLPPLSVVPEIDTTDFALEVLDHDLSALQIPEIVTDDSPLMGMNKRICYEIQAQEGEDLKQTLKTNFCNPSNNDFQLGNSVVKVADNGEGLQLMNNMGAESGGTIIVEDSFTVGTFRKVSSPEKSPLVLMSEKGSISVNNKGQHPTLAYLIALNKNKGQVKPVDAGLPLNLIGGIAATDLDPQQIKGGGQLYYNPSLDPVADNFSRHIGVVIGPAGGSQ
ncbi:MAG: hypothetical protein ACQETH_02005 [Candidatus Rifleibacteriota bacterium]